MKTLTQTPARINLVTRWRWICEAVRLARLGLHTAEIRHFLAAWEILRNLAR